MEERASLTSPRILVVEDDPSELSTVHAVLTDSGYHVHPAPNAAFALRFLDHATPDLILMDVGLPDQSGFQLCATLKSRADTAEIPVIFVSAADKLSDRMRAFAAGAVDYVVKPFETAEILARIGTHLSLRALQLRLEERVQERTAELESANTRLRASEERRRQPDRGRRRTEPPRSAAASPSRCETPARGSPRMSSPGPSPRSARPTPAGGPGKARASVSPSAERTWS
jgi:DNA-binding response OmpR family regulator